MLEACVKRTGLTPNQARALLGRFLFSGEEAEKPLDGLSGGERRRLSLAILVSSGANVLILDEPTNHLDLESREALEDALRSFQGSLLLVTHDRALLDAVGTRTVAIEDHAAALLRRRLGRVRARARGAQGARRVAAVGDAAAAPRPTNAASPRGATDAGGQRRRHGEAASPAGPSKNRAREQAAPRARGRGGRGGARRARGRARGPGRVGDEVRVGEVDGAPHRGQARGRGRLRGARGVRGEGLVPRPGRSHVPWMPWALGHRAPEGVLPFIRAARRQIPDNDGMQTAIVASAARLVGVVGVPRRRLRQRHDEHRLLDAGGRLVAVNGNPGDDERHAEDLGRARELGQHDDADDRCGRRQQRDHERVRRA